MTKTTEPKSNGTHSGVELAVGAPRVRPNFAPQRIAVVGATGMVGRELLSILEERKYPVRELRLLASERSQGEQVSFADTELTVDVVTANAFRDCDVVFFAAGGSVTRSFVAAAAEAGAVSIDKSSAYRLDSDVPLVVPGVNNHALKHISKTRKLIASPNCSTTQLVQTLAPLDREFGLRRVVVSTYQAVSGAGKHGVEELERQVRQLFNFENDVDTSTFGRRIAFNCLPAIPGREKFLANGKNQEEQKMVDETRKILGKPNLPIGVTCVRVPVFNGHSEAVHVELETKPSVDAVRAALAAADDVAVVDDGSTIYPTPEDAVGDDNTMVGRIRSDDAFENGFAFWVVSDNLRTGAALNAVRIAETLFSERT